MSQVITALRHHAHSNPYRMAIQDGRVTLCYGELLTEVERLANRLEEIAPRLVAILADNSSSWALADLAAHKAGIPFIPLPIFFSSEQLAHIIRTAGVDYVITDQPDRIFAALQEKSPSIETFHDTLKVVRLTASIGTRLPPGTQKITFTSGTTGEPKGVCLGREEMGTVAESLRLASEACSDDRHLCLLPLATLLENIGGVYTPLMAGATICLPRLADVGMTGSSSLKIERMLFAMNQWKASSAILVPQMLQALVAAGKAGVPMPKILRYLAVGGAPVAETLLRDATKLGLPVYEGYGLSECASVVAVNRPKENRVGSVGMPLPHVRIAFAEDGEILIRHDLWKGYLGTSPKPLAEDYIATGDLGYQDEDGYLYLTGRKKNIFITSFGRNVAPEWVERELVARPPIAQAAVFGEARPFNSAVIVSYPSATPDEVSIAIADANKRLPDYARIHAWIPAKESFSSSNGMATPNGRLRRSTILGAHSEQINALYQQ